ncbi:hypothetical protein X747_22775 [Mesorhizobium sp. LNJC384A00]|nr:hypothetical protein X747_22775 [Mesorhizobium sp. LNJC384A00]
MSLDEGEPLAAFVGQPLRSFYQQAICGGLVFQLSDGSRLVRTVVAMAFQSVLAGIMLAADLVKHSAGFPIVRQPALACIYCAPLVLTSMIRKPKIPAAAASAAMRISFPPTG